MDHFYYKSTLGGLKTAPEEAYICLMNRSENKACRPPFILQQQQYNKYDVMHQSKRFEIVGNTKSI